MCIKKIILKFLSIFQTCQSHNKERLRWSQIERDKGKIMIQYNAVSRQILEKTKGTIEKYLRKSE